MIGRAVTGVRTGHCRKKARMRITRNLGFLLLGIWLILTGLEAFVPLGSIGLLLSLLAIAAGVLILLQR